MVDEVEGREEEEVVEEEEVEVIVVKIEEIETSSIPLESYKLSIWDTTSSSSRLDSWYFS